MYQSCPICGFLFGHAQDCPKNIIKICDKCGWANGKHSPECPKNNKIKK